MSAPAEQVDPLTGEVLDEDAPDTGGWDRERHCATDLRGVDWAGRKLLAAQEQVAINDTLGYGEVQALKMRIAQAEKRLERANAPFLKTVAFMENAIRVFAQANRAEVLKGLPKDRKSRLLPSGVTVGYRARREGYFWDDALKEGDRKAKLLEWCRLEEDVSGELLIKSNPAPDLDAIKKHLAAQVAAGEHLGVPPGLKYVEPGEELVIWTDLSKEEGK